MYPFRKALLACFLATPLLLLSAQEKYIPGKVITNSADTIPGLIEMIGEVGNAKRCVFKQNENADRIVYYPGSIHGYQFDDGRFWVTKIMTDSVRTDTVFAEYLIDGLVRLYYDGLNGSYILEKEGGDTVRLHKTQKVLENDYGVKYEYNPKTYIGLMNALMTESPTIRQEINKAKLSHKSLINITSQYHELVCDEDDWECKVYQREMPKFEVKVAPFLGGSSNSMAIYNHLAYGGDLYLNMPAQNSWLVGIDADLLFPRVRNRWIFQVHAAVMPVNYNGYKIVGHPQDSWRGNVSYSTSGTSYMTRRGCCLAFWRGKKRGRL